MCWHKNTEIKWRLTVIFQTMDQACLVDAAMYHLLLAVMDPYIPFQLAIRQVSMLHQMSTVESNLCLNSMTLKVLMWSTSKVLQRQSINVPLLMNVPPLHKTSTFDLHDQFVWYLLDSIREKRRNRKWAWNEIAIHYSRYTLAPNELNKEMALTKINNCAIAKFPIAHAKCSDVLKSRELTVEFTSSLEHRANANSNAFISDLEFNECTKKVLKWIISIARIFCGVAQCQFTWQQLRPIAVHLAHFDCIRAKTLLPHTLLESIFRALRVMISVLV